MAANQTTLTSPKEGQGRIDDRLAWPPAGHATLPDEEKPNEGVRRADLAWFLPLRTGNLLDQLEA